MAPTAVLDKITTTTIKTSTTTSNNLSVYIAETSVVNSLSFFGEFQDTVVESSELTIRTIIPPTIHVKPYRKAMIAIILFRRIISLSFFPSISISDLKAKIVAYFVLHTDSMDH